MSRRFVFTAGVEQDDDGRWSAWTKEIPWCITFGDTQSDAIAELHDAASVVVQYLEQEGKEIPVVAQLPIVVEV